MVKRRATSFNDLPHEMAFHIFLRLPVKSLIQSSAVSKTWYSLLKDPNFVPAHISRSISSRKEDAVLIIPTDITYDKYCYLISAESGFVFDKYKIPFVADNLKLVGSVNGLVCLTDEFVTRNYHHQHQTGGGGDPFLDVFRKTEYQNVYMWNPCVRKYKCIASSCFRKRYVSEVKISFALGFGFVEADRDYRVVRIMYLTDHRGKQFGKYTPRVEVFSLRKNKWWEIKDSLVVRVDSKIGTTVNSTVYWVKERSSETDSQGVWILSFDFNTEVFGRIKLPDDVCYSSNGIMDFQLMKFEGSLSVCASEGLTQINGMLHRPCCIWLISHEDGIVCATLRFRVVLEKFGEPLNITKGGALLMMPLYPRSTCHVLSCTLKNMHYFEFHKAIGTTKPHNADTFFIESLGGDEVLTSANDCLLPGKRSPGITLQRKICF